MAWTVLGVVSGEWSAEKYRPYYTELGMRYFCEANVVVFVTGFNLLKLTTSTGPVDPDLSTTLSGGAR